MLQACIGLKLFDFGWLGSGQSKNLTRRIFVSFVIINLLPFLYFAFIFLWLNSLRIPLSFNWLSVLDVVCVFFLSLFVFGFYRLLHIIISIKKGKLLYTHGHLENLEKPELDEKTCDGRKYYVTPRKRLREMGLNWKGHLIGFLIYLFLALLGFFVLLLQA
jgi:hypothetical protein